MEGDRLIGEGVDGMIFLSRVDSGRWDNGLFSGAAGVASRVAAEGDADVADDR